MQKSTLESTAKAMWQKIRVRGTKVRRTTQADTQVDPNEGLGDFETKYLDWVRGKDRIQWDDGTWRVPKAGETARHFDPFMICVSNSGIFEKGNFSGTTLN